ncbi:hypothetical protein D9611_008014 [Ephemerocybe angulata]|uniref:BTB domain-containing protein n=1 Tax=Ephemerocybe angulata TaxID=980116 RepID=A0A8H5BZR5_9AGAR|nr:hypothetical protein D9611_008014 [Tulosesus angulatus]
MALDSTAPTPSAVLLPTGKIVGETGHFALQVQDRVLCVPPGLVEACSSVFEKMLATEGGVKGESGSSKNPLALKGCTIAELECFIKVLSAPRGAPVALQKEEWISVLRMATMWDALLVRPALPLASD